MIEKIKIKILNITFIINFNKISTKINNSKSNNIIIFYQILYKYLVFIT